MSSNIMNEDLRSIKTEKALYVAMLSLLEKFNFRKITVKGICEEALISRAAFYSHFIDKYDLLKRWLMELWSKNFNENNTYEQMEKVINNYIYENKCVLKNLIYDADNETFDIFFDCILYTKNLTIKKNNDKDAYHKNVALSNFYAGGVISYLLWHIKNRFPADVPIMNKYFYEMINKFKD